jgi:pimeloyl-ACP methyl ester carboxylesterase
MKRTLLSLGLATALLAGCSARGGGSAGSTTAPSDATTTPTDTDRTTTSGEATDTTSASDPVEPIAWSACDRSYECGEVSVPLDYAEPDGTKITIAVVRASKAADGEKIGSLFLNPGGPGASGVDFAESIPLPNELTRRFDIIGFDPRGVGRSSPIDCHSHLQAIYDANPVLDDAATKAHYLEVSKAFVDECESKAGTVLPHLGTRNVARDLDRLREAVGDDELNYLGFSYGTSIGQQYAKAFPTKVRTMVLDGVVDPSMTGLEAAEFQAKGFESALDTFIADCDKTKCVTGGTAAVIDRVQAASKKTPIPAPGTDRPATRGVVDLAIADALYSEYRWPDLGDALQQADQGNGTGLVELADEYLSRKADGSYDNGFEIYFGVSCIDSAWPKDPEKIFAAAKETAKVAPRMGEALVNDYVRCALWPVDPDPLEPVPTDVKGLAPIVLISTTGDPATPYQNGVDVAHAIPGAKLITYRGEGHTVFANGVACVDDAVTSYLVEAKAPSADLTC